MMPRGSSIVTGSSVSRRSLRVSTCSERVVSVIAPPGVPSSAPPARRVAHRAHVAREPRVLAVGRELAALGGQRERRAPGLGQVQLRVGELARLVVGEVLGARRRDRLARLAVGAERDRAEVLDVHVGLVPGAPRAGVRRRLHLRVEPVGERGEAAEQQHGRPGGQPVEQVAGAVHRRQGRPARRSPRRSTATGRSRPALRGEDQLGELAHGAEAALAARHVVRVPLAPRRARAERSPRARTRASAARRAGRRRCARRPSARRRASRAAAPTRGSLSSVPLKHVRDAEPPRAVHDRVGRAAGDPRDRRRRRPRAA